MNTIDLNAEYNAASAYHAAYANYYHSKGWITCDAHCQHYKRIMNKKKQIWDEIKAEGNARMSDAKTVAGLFSEVGVGEVTDTFWEYFASGKQFAKRQSNESMVEYMLKMLMQVLINFSMRLVMALVVSGSYLPLVLYMPLFFASQLTIRTISRAQVFIFGLWKIIQTYQPNPLTALFFFITAVCAAFAFVTTYLLTLYGDAAGGVYGFVKLAESNMRIEGDRRRNIQGGRLPPRQQHAKKTTGISAVLRRWCEQISSPSGSRCRQR